MENLRANSKNGSKLRGILRKLDRVWYRLNGEAIESCENPEKIKAKDLLSEHQLEIFKSAMMWGYFSYPRKINLTKLSEKLEISPPTLCAHIQKIESKLMGLFSYG